MDPTLETLDAIAAEGTRDSCLGPPATIRYLSRVPAHRWLKGSSST